MMKREILEVDVLFVGAGPASLAGAIQLNRLMKAKEKEIAIAVIEKGAEVDARDKYGDTPLHRVVQKDSLSVGKLLTTNGADIDAMNRYGHTPRHWVLGSSEELSVDSPLTDSHSANTDGLVLSRIDDQEDA